MVLRRPSADPTPLSSGWTTAGFPADPPTSPKPTNTTFSTTPPPSVTYIDIQALITNNCSFLHPGPLTIATSYGDNTWTAHVTRGRRILLSASAPDLNGALVAVHRKSAEAVASRLVTSPPPLNYAEMESYSEDEDEDDEDEDEDEEDGGEDEEEEEEEEEELVPFWASTSEPHPCCGHGPRACTRLLPIPRPAPRQRMIPPPPPPPPADTVPPPPRPPTSPRPPPAALRSPTGGPRCTAPPLDHTRGQEMGPKARSVEKGRGGPGSGGRGALDCRAGGVRAAPRVQDYTDGQ